MADNLFYRFFKSETATGATLFMAALLAIVAANSEWIAPIYEHWLHAPIGLVLGDKIFSFSVSHFINDGLMAAFFLLVGLEIKRELIVGELCNRASAILPAIAAAGGMALPALIYSFFNWGDAYAMRGWAIPTATDIAFSLGVLSLLGSRVPLSIKVFLTAVAVIDDLGAIAIIAIFYTDSINVAALILSFFVLSTMFFLNRRGVTAILPYVFGFLVLWVCVLQSGVHATLAGVATAFAVPLRVTGKKQPPPLEVLEHNLRYPVAYVILPIFAFANAGVSFVGFSLPSLAQPIPMGIGLGLVFGKMAGISAAVWLAIKLGLSSMPRDCCWVGMAGIATLCGIGFTVSLFIGNLSFSDPDVVNTMKIGVFGGSIFAGICGFIFLRFAAFNRR